MSQSVPPRMDREIIHAAANAMYGKAGVDRYKGSTAAAKALDTDRDGYIDKGELERALLADEVVLSFKQVGNPGSSRKAAAAAEAMSAELDGNDGKKDGFIDILRDRKLNLLDRICSLFGSFDRVWPAALVTSRLLRGELVVGSWSNADQGNLSDRKPIVELREGPQGPTLVLR